MKIGMNREEAIKFLEPKEEIVTTEQQMVDNKPQEASKYDNTINNYIEKTYVYTAENFIDDCRSLIKEISTPLQHPNPIEVLIGLQRSPQDFPTLHHINSRGIEQEIDDYYAIGSGEPYVRMFFERIYDYNKDIRELITHAFRVIVYVQHMALESSVGYSDDFPPEALVVFPSETDEFNFGRLDFKNHKEVLTKIVNEMTNFESLVKDNKIPSLDPE